MNHAETMVIQTHDLSKEYAGVRALDGLNLNVPKHSIFGFLGANGAGKSTTIKLLLGLIQPTGGSATVFGQDIVQDNVTIRTRVGYLAQDPRFYDYMTARETLDFTARFFYTGPTRQITARIAEMLDLVGLADKADRPIRGFSGGERQRLGIAQAQINYPDLLILDEPAAALDPQGRHDVLTIMERLRKHTTIFYSTHLLDDVQRVSDRVAILNHGRLVAEAPIADLLGRGNGNTSYTLTLRGNPAAAQARVAAQPWVHDLAATQQDGQITWRVSVTDEAAAEAHLLGLISADRNVTVTAFGRQTQNLEDVFLRLMEGSNHNGR
jgi:ABC-2 type transport system ATP-binding protein